MAIIGFSTGPWTLFACLGLPVSLLLTRVRIDISKRLLREQARVRLARDELTARSGELEAQREALSRARESVHFKWDVLR